MRDFDDVFAISDAIRYVALYKNGVLRTAQRDGIGNASNSESDKYEELFVNPTLLTLAKQRGNVDCGGAKFVVVGYGNFNQLVIDLPNGHLSVCFQHGANPIDYVDALTALF
jgi:hypothetical protein